jgi:hypothetical protein
MNVDGKSLEEMLSNVCMVCGCELIETDLFRLPTHFRYPDGSLVDLFLSAPRDNAAPYWLTDLGHTAAYLADVHIYLHRNKRRQALVGRICQIFEVEEKDGELMVAVGNLSTIGDAVSRLAQACARISDLSFTQRFRQETDYNNRVETFFDAGNLIYSTSVKLIGKYNREVTVDFLVEGVRFNHLVMTLSTLNPASAHPMANEAFRRWYDLELHRNQYGFVTLYDSTNDCIREDDVMRLSEISSTFAFPAEADTIQEVISA